MAEPESATCRETATVEDALSLVGELRRASNVRTPLDFRVTLPGGELRIGSPIKVDNRIHGTVGGVTEIRGSRTQRTVVMGSVPLQRTASMLGADVAERLPPGVGSRVHAYPLPPAVMSVVRGIGPGGYGYPARRADVLVYSRCGTSQMATWPRSGFQRLSSEDIGTEAPGPAVLPLPAGPDWIRILGSQTAVRGYWQHDWADETLPVRRIERDARLAELAAPRARFAVTPGARFQVINSFAGANSPGDWVVDLSAARVFMVDPECSGTVEAAVADRLLEVKGVRDLRVIGVSFEGALGDGIVIEKAEGVELTDVTVANVGSRGIVLSAVRSSVQDSEVRSTGEDGIVLDAGSRNPWRVGDSKVINCTVHRVGQVVRTYRPAVRVTGVGNAVIGTEMRDMPHAAVLFGGNAHELIGNVVRNVTTETADAGAMYISMDWTAHGNRVMFNVIEGRPAVGLRGSLKGIYLDDQASGVTVHGNVIAGYSNAVFVGGGSDIEVTGNVMIRTQPALRMDARGLSWQRNLVESPGSTLRTRLADAFGSGGELAKRYPRLRDYAASDLGRPQRNVFARNLLVASGSPVIDADVPVSGRGGPSADFEAPLGTRGLIDCRRDLVPAIERQATPAQVKQIVGRWQSAVVTAAGERTPGWYAPCGG